MASKCFELYRYELIEQYFDANTDAYIRIDDDFLPVSTLVLKWLEFFRNIIDDTDAQLYNGKLILMENKTSDIPYINRTTVTHLYEYIKNNIIGYAYNTNISIVDQIDYILLIDHLATKCECEKLIVHLTDSVELCAKLIDSPYTNVQTYFSDDIRYKTVQSLIDINPNDCRRICSYYKIIYGSIPPNLKFYIQESAMVYLKSIHSIYKYHTYKSYFFLINQLELPTKCKFIENFSSVEFIWCNDTLSSEKKESKLWIKKHGDIDDGCILCTCKRICVKFRLHKRAINNNYYFMNNRDIYDDK